MKKRTWPILVAAVLAAAVIQPAGAYAAETSGSRTDLVSESIEEIQAKSVISEAEMDKLIEGLEQVDGESVELRAPESAGRASAKAVSPLCQQDTGLIWKRTSGDKKFKYGAIGGKPKITCNTEVTHLSLTTTLYVKNNFGLWSKIAGAFTNQNWGAKSLTQKSVEFACKATGPYNDFRMVANGSVTYPGLKPIAGGAYSDTPKPGIPCGA